MLYYFLDFSTVAILLKINVLSRVDTLGSEWNELDVKIILMRKFSLKWTSRIFASMVYQKVPLSFEKHSDLKQYINSIINHLLNKPNLKKN